MLDKNHVNQSILVLSDLQLFLSICFSILWKVVKTNTSFISFLVHMFAVEKRFLERSDLLEFLGLEHISGN
jgi:hypothetical protein